MNEFFERVAMWLIIVFAMIGNIYIMSILCEVIIRGIETLSDL